MPSSKQTSSDAYELARLALEQEQEQEPCTRPVWMCDRIQSLAELNRKPIPELKWIVQDLLTEGLTVFAGMLKAGKSYLITNIALAIAEGKPVLGQTAVERGRILYITPDDKQEARLRARMQAMRGGRTDDIPFDIATDWTPLDVEVDTDTGMNGIQEIEEYIKFYKGTEYEVKLVVIDVLMSVLPGIKEDADAYDKIYHKLMPLKDVAQTQHVSIVLVMHMNKGQGNNGNPRNRIYGSMAYGAIADNILMLDEDYNTHQRFLLTSGKDLEQGKYAMAFDPKTGIYTYGEERMAELQAKNVSQEIGDIVKAHPGIKRHEIVSILVGFGVKPGTADQRVTRAASKDVREICQKPGMTGYYPCSDTLVTPATPEFSCEGDDCDPD